MFMLPLFALVLLSYLFLYWIGFFPAHLNEVPIVLTMPSGGLLRNSYGDWLLVLGLLALAFEIFKATNVSDSSILERVLATIIFVIYLVIWLTETWASNNYFMLLTLMAFLNVIGGFVVTYASAKPKMIF